MHSPTVLPQPDVKESPCKYAQFVRAAIKAYKKRCERVAIFEQTSGLEPDEMRFVIAEVKV